MKSRRALLGLIGAALSAPRLAFAQARKIPLVAVLFIGDSEDDEMAARPFFESMERSGWVEGRNIAYERHSGKGTRQYLETMVSNAAGSQPDLVFATTGSLAAAVVKETSSLPVVFTTMADPVAAGLVASLARPGRNASGAFQVQGDASDRRFALVKEVMPQLKRMGSVFDRGGAGNEQRKAQQLKAARAHGLELVVSEFVNFEVIAKIFAQYKRDGIHAAEITPSYPLTGRRREVVALAERNGIALFAHRAEWADAGAVLTYGVDIGESYRRAASVAHRILKGERPAELAVELPKRFELVVNQRAALALGLSIPKALQQQANRVIA